MKTITIKNLTLNTPALANLVEKIDYEIWNSQTKARIDRLIEKSCWEPEPYTYEDMARNIIEDPDEFMPELIEDCEKLGIDLETPREEFEGVVMINGEPLDEYSLAGKLSEVSQKGGFHDGFADLWSAYIDSLEIDHTALAAFLFANPSYMGDLADCFKEADELIELTQTARESAKAEG